MARINEADESRRRFLIAALATGLFGAAGCSSTTDVARLSAGRSIYQLLGHVLVNGAKATLDTPVIPGDLVETFDKSYIIFVVASESYILRSNSRLIVGASGGQALNLSSGKLLSVFTPGNPIQIATPSALVSIRGTGLYVESEETRSYVCTCYGTTTIAVNGQPTINEAVTSKHHDAPKYVINDGSDQRIEPAPFKNHDDEELLLLETLVGRSTPFVVPSGINRSRRSYY